MKNNRTLKSITQKLMLINKVDENTLPLKVKFEDDRYLAELMLHKQLTQKSRKALNKGQFDGPFEYIKIKKFNPSERNNFKLTYDKDSHILLDSRGNPADTTGANSKGYEDAMAFVYGLDNKLYLFHHTYLKSTDEYTTHGSVFSDRPIKMSGIMKIENGQITYISNDSGHYQPNSENMYLFLRELQTKMPGSISKSTIIDDDGQKYKLQLFMKDNEIDEKEMINLMKEQSHIEVEDFKSISFYSFIENHQYLEAATLLCNSKYNIQIDMDNQIEVAAVSKLIENLSTQPELKEMALRKLEKRGFEEFRAMDQLSQIYHSNSTTPETISTEESASDDTKLNKSNHNSSSLMDVVEYSSLRDTDTSSKQTISAIEDNNSEKSELKKRRRAEFEADAVKEQFTQDLTTLD